MNKKTVVSYVILYMVWSFLELFVVPRFASRMSPAVLSVLKEGFIKTLLWLLPAILLARRYEESLSIKTRSLMHRRIGNLAILAIVLVFTAFLSAAAYYQKGQLSVSESFSVSDLFVAISIGFSEEMFFRGWLLNANLCRGKWPQMLMNSILFLLIHFPVWIRNGIFINYITSGLFLEIIILSLVFSWAFIRSESIVVPAVLHAYWDFLCFLFGL